MKPLFSLSAVFLAIGIVICSCEKDPIYYILRNTKWEKQQNITSLETIVFQDNNFYGDSNKGSYIRSKAYPNDPSNWSTILQGTYYYEYPYIYFLNPYVMKGKMNSDCSSFDLEGYTFVRVDFD